MIDQFPDDANWEDAVHEFEIAAAIAQGVKEADRGEFASDEEVAAVFAKSKVNRFEPIDVQAIRAQVGRHTSTLGAR